MLHDWFGREEPHRSPYRLYAVSNAGSLLALIAYPIVVEVVLGDGRIVLERELAASSDRPRYDVLIIDAFSGDAVPVHLLTLESLELYRRSLVPGGVLVLQITNRHVDLERVVRGLADAAGLKALRLDQAPTEDSGGIRNA